MGIETKVEDNIENDAVRDKIRAHNDYTWEELAISACCVCQAFKFKDEDDKKWRPIDFYKNIEDKKKIILLMKGIGYKISHGHCPPCYKKVCEEWQLG